MPIHRRGRAYAATIALVVAVAGSITAFASCRNSVTFDEPYMIAAGARGMATGDFFMVWDQPPGMLYTYGAAVHLFGAAARLVGHPGFTLPSESGTFELPPEAIAQLPRGMDVSSPLPRWGMYNRYNYARELFFNVGNDPESLAFAARLAAVLIAMTLAAAVGAFAWRRSGPLAALLTTTIFAFLPDVMAHGGVAYNDVPLALWFFLALWALDNFVRQPSARHAAVGGIAVALALGVKFSALVLGPAVIVLVAIEAVAREDRGPWLKRLVALAPLALAVTVLVLIVVYRGDVTLNQFREGVREQLGHTGGHGVPTLLLGRTSENGFWYFFPVAIVLKTPVALHVLGLIAVVGYAAGWRWKREFLTSPLRLLPVGIAVYLAILMRTNLNIGVRHALPVLPLLALLIGIGVSRVWEARTVRVRVAIVALVLAHAASTVSNYPWFLSYITEYFTRGSRQNVMVDSNLDWGQGLLALRDFMRKEGIEGVNLAYFGSALPEGYGITYAPLPSWIDLPAQPRPRAPFTWVAVSATRLQGHYGLGDQFAELRARKADRILAGSLFLYRMR